MPDRETPERPFGWQEQDLADNHDSVEVNADLDGWRQMLEHKRAERKLTEETLLSWLVTGVSWAIVILAILTLYVYAWNIWGFAHCRWLGPDDLARVERAALSILSGVAASAAVAWLFRKR